MTEPYEVITIGELNASIEGVGEFKTKEVEFIGSKDAADCLIQGIDSKRGFIFYLPDCVSGEYGLHPGSDAKAFYEVGGRLYGEVEEGSIHVSFDEADRVDIVFDILMKDNSEGTSIRVTGCAFFEGKMPWTDKHRALLNIAQGNAPLWLDGPDIIQPNPGKVSPGFEIVGRTGIANPDDWELQILIGADVIHRNTGQSGRSFSYDVPPRLIARGTGFYFRLDYYITPLWSKWTYSGNMEMDSLGNPQILKPLNNDFVTTDTPEVSGTGFPGANIVVKTVDGTRVVGTAKVGEDRNWSTPLRNVLDFPVAIHARQTLFQDGSDFSNIVNINRRYSELKRPVIRKPTNNAFVKRTAVEVSGRDCHPGAVVKLYKSGSGVVLYGSGTVGEDGTWTIMGKSELFFLGPFTMTVQQSFEGRLSEYSEDVKITLTL